VLVGTTAGFFIYLERLYPGATKRAVRQQARFGLRIAGCTAGMVLATLAVRYGIDSLRDPPPGLRQAIVVVPAVFVGALTYVALSLAAGLSEPRRIGQLARDVLLSAR
jgi:hypothetical protein